MLQLSRVPRVYRSSVEVGLREAERREHRIAPIIVAGIPGISGGDCEGGGLDGHHGGRGSDHGGGPEGGAEVEAAAEVSATAVGVGVHKLLAWHSGL